MPQICDVKRELYVPSPQPHVASMLSAGYIGKGLRRWEELSNQSSSDWPDTIRTRVSEDNGRTWSSWELAHAEWPEQNGHTREETAFCSCYDPVAQKTIEMIFQRIVIGDPQSALLDIWEGHRRLYDHGFYHVSDDDGRNWAEMRQLKHEDGPSFNENEWGNPEFLSSNNMYGGYNIIPVDGEIVYPASRAVPCCDKGEDEKLTAHIPFLYGEGHVAGVFCFIGRWDPKQNDYTWRTTRPLTLPRHISTRGLFEPAIAELTNGNLLLDMRGSNWEMDPMVTPGRRWISVSNDRGNTWSKVTDLRYDTGEPFYSPSSHSRLTRSAKTGNLYWVGNISDTPPSGNSPRYPLMIAEIDEDRPALKRDTLTVIDDRNPECDSEPLQLSNFSLFENRETLELELYLTRLGERGDEPDQWTADAVKYTITL